MSLWRYMGDKCSHCGVKLDTCYVDDVYIPPDSLTPVVQQIISHSNTGHSVWNNRGRSAINTALQKHSETPQNQSLTLENLLPEDHQVFLEIQKNIELEGLLETNPLQRVSDLHELANSQRKFAKKTRDWMKHKSPFMDTEFQEKLEKSPYIWTKNIRKILVEPCQRKEIICINCGTVVRTFIDMQEKIETIFESVKTLRTYLDYLSRYDSAMTNWVRDDNIEKEKAKKIRTEKNLQAELETLEAQRRSAEEKLRKLQDE